MRAPLPSHGLALPHIAPPPSNNPLSHSPCPSTCTTALHSSTETPHPSAGTIAIHTRRPSASPRHSHPLAPPPPPEGLAPPPPLHPRRIAQVYERPVMCVPCGHTFCDKCMDKTRDDTTDLLHCRECGGATATECVPVQALELLSGKFTYRKQVLSDLLTDVLKG